MPTNDLPTQHRGATINYQTNDVDLESLFARITLPGGEKTNVTERLLRVVTEDETREDHLSIRRRSFGAAVIAKIDRVLDGATSWVVTVAAD